MKYELTKDLETGNVLIDSEHRQLFAVINKLMDALFNLSVFLEKHYEQKTIILIDE